MKVEKAIEILSKLDPKLELCVEDEFDENCPWQAQSITKQNDPYFGEVVIIT